jgi:hypothetical protein
MIRGLSNVGQYGEAKQCAINVFDTDFIMSADRVMGSIIHQAQNLDADVSTNANTADSGIAVNAFLADRKRQGGRGFGGWTADKKKSKFSMKCGACGDPNHVWSTGKAPDDDVLRWTLAKRKQYAVNNHLPLLTSATSMLTWRQREMLLLRTHWSTTCMTNTTTQRSVHPLPLSLSRPLQLLLRTCLITG